MISRNTSKLYIQKELVFLETPITEIHEKTTFQRDKNWHFIFHMCVSSKTTTVQNNDTRHLNSGAIYMIFYGVVVMQSG